MALLSMVMTLCPGVPEPRDKCQVNKRPPRVQAASCDAVGCCGQSRHAAGFTHDHATIAAYRSLLIVSAWPCTLDAIIYGYALHRGRRRGRYRRIWFRPNLKVPRIVIELNL